MNLENIAQKYKEAKELSTRILPDDTDARVRSTLLGKIRKAKQDLEDIITDYRAEAAKRAVIMLPIGAGKKMFLDTASESFGAYRVHLDDLFNEIIEDIHPSYYENAPAGPNIFGQMQEKFDLIAMQVGVNSYDAVLFESKYQKQLKDKKDLLNLCRESYLENLGGELVALYIINKVSRKAVEDEFGGKLLPIVVDYYGKDDNLIKKAVEEMSRVSILGLTIKTKKDMSEENVKEELIKVKETAIKKGVVNA